MTKLIDRLKQNEFTRIHIDENCIVGWATAYYKAVPTARKEDFIGDETGKHKTIGEIRNPSVFAEYIYPYTGATNVKFQYLMDKLNDTLQKRTSGRSIRLRRMKRSRKSCCVWRLTVFRREMIM